MKIKWKWKEGKDVKQRRETKTRIKDKLRDKDNVIEGQIDGINHPETTSSRAPLGLLADESDKSLRRRKNSQG